MIQHHILTTQIIVTGIHWIYNINIHIFLAMVLLSASWICLNLRIRHILPAELYFVNATGPWRKFEVITMGDDWLFDSIKKYKKLYMYDLQKPILAADWVNSDSQHGLVVAISDAKKHELLELSLPSQISVKDDNTCLTKDRDFRVVNGGFSDDSIAHIHDIPNSRNVLTSPSGDNSVETWQLGSVNGNTIAKTGSLSNHQPLNTPAEVCVLDTQLVFGSHLSSLCVADLNIHKVISHSQDSCRQSAISNITRHGSSVLTCDRSTGDLFVLDPRLDSLSPQPVSSPVNGVTSCWTLCQERTPTGQDVLQMSNGGTFCARDFRNLKRCVKRVQSKLRSEVDASSNIRISRCPSNPELLAVSGFDGNVHLFDESSWTDGEDVTALFVHRGHTVDTADQSETINTTIHLWYPWQQGTLLSAANDGSLNLFQPVLST